MLRLDVKFLKILNSETDPSQISLAFSFSMIMGLTPIMSLHNLFVLLLVLLLKVNLTTFILGTAVFSVVAYLPDPLFHWIGLHLLTTRSLESLWTILHYGDLNGFKRGVKRIKTVFIGYF